MSEISKNESVTTQCKHVFHKKCLDKWKDCSSSNTCPLCRAVISKPFTFPSRRRTLEQREMDIRQEVDVIMRTYNEVGTRIENDQLNTNATFIMQWLEEL